MKRSALWWSFACVAVLGTNCSPTTPGSDGGDASADSAVPSDQPPVPDDTGVSRCTATAPTCVDQQVAQLRLYDTVSPADVHAEPSDMSGVFYSYIDARGGGMSATQSFVYARFTSTGLAKVAISDEASFSSLDWDIAFRRYVLRVNSGVGGPSCTEVAQTADGTTFASVTSHDNLAFDTEAYFDQQCQLVPDSSGINSPNTTLATFWQYISCVETTGKVFVVHLRDGRYVKLEVLSYYDPAAQQECNSSGNVPSPNGAGQIRIRWSFLAP